MALKDNKPKEKKISEKYPFNILESYSWLP